MEEENLDQKETTAGREHKECLDNIINTLREEQRRGNLEELLVFFTLESGPSIQRFFSIKTGHTLHQVVELIDEFARERRNQQN